MSNLTCGFVGLGLIGGSIAKALKAADNSIQIVAYDINELSLSAAKKENIADIITTTIDASFQNCDFIFLCAPVSHNDSNLNQIKKYLSPNCILTDVGSVKTNIHEHIASAGLSNQFIGGHPMAGSERIGYANSKALLLENAYYILTPTTEVSQKMIHDYQALVSSIGAIPLILSYDQHDYVTGAVSHLPHIIAASLVHLVKNSDSEDGIMKTIAAGGFKDITRIASSSPDMWQQICLTNTDYISSLLDKYIHSLEAIQKQLKQKSSSDLYHFFDDARMYRDSFINASSGPIKREYALTVEIADEPGALASIATMLALHSISIKNIGIVHNREQEEGALRIEFNSESDVQGATELLSAKAYVVHKKII